MTDPDVDKMKRMLRDAMPSIQREPKHDLWPLMLRRLDQSHGPVIPRITWVDWVLTVLLALWFWLLPSAIPILLYQI